MFALLSLAVVAALLFDLHSWRQPLSFAADTATLSTSPSSGPAAGGTTLTVSGLSFPAYQTSDYVQTGTDGATLVAMYDARNNAGTMDNPEHTQSSTTWNDLAEGSAGALQNTYIYTQGGGVTAGPASIDYGDDDKDAAAVYDGSQHQYAQSSGQAEYSQGTYVVAEARYKVDSSYTRNVVYNFSPASESIYGTSGNPWGNLMTGIFAAKTNTTSVLATNVSQGSNSNEQGWVNTAFVGSDEQYTSRDYQPPDGISLTDYATHTNTFSQASNGQTKNTTYAYVNASNSLPLYDDPGSGKAPSSMTVDNDSVSPGDFASNSYLWINCLGIDTVNVSSEKYIGGGTLSIQNLRFYAFTSTPTTTELNDLTATNYAVDNARYGSAQDLNSSGLKVKLGSETFSGSALTTDVAAATTTLVTPSLAALNSAGGTSYSAGQAIPLAISYDSGATWTSAGDFTYTPAYQSIGFKYYTQSGGVGQITPSQSSGYSGSADVSENVTTCVATIKSSGSYYLETDVDWTGPAADGDTPDSSSAAPPPTAQHSLEVAAGAVVTLYVDANDVSLEQGADSGLPGIKLDSGASLTLDVGSGLTMTAVGAAGDASTTSPTTRAGISVPAGCTFTAKGKGSLTAKGGDISSSAGNDVPTTGSENLATGAGIGGDAFENAGSDTSVGSIDLTGSLQVTATGGAIGSKEDASDNWSDGAKRGFGGSGAGIGGGGSNGTAAGHAYDGNIAISDEASVTAEGGWSDHRSGAGIGGGGFSYCEADDSSTGHSLDVAISTSGTVFAQGGDANYDIGAGIGTGAEYTDNLQDALPASIKISSGDVLAKGGQSRNRGAAAGIGWGDVFDSGSQTLPGPEVNISGGTVVAQGSTWDADRQVDGIGAPCGGSTGKKETLTDFSCSISGGSVLATNPNTSPATANAIYAQPTASAGGGAALYPVYVASQLPTDAQGDLASTNGVVFNAGSYSATSAGWVGEGSLDYSAADDSTQTATFDPVPSGTTQVACQVDAVMWLPADSSANATAISANGAFSSASALRASVTATNSPDQKAVTAGTTIVPGQASLGYVFYYIPSYVGYTVSPTTGVSADERDNTLTIAPSADATYTISDDSGWGDLKDGSDSADDALPDHRVVIAPTAAGVTVTLQVVGDTTAEPEYGTADGSHSATPSGIAVSDGQNGTTLDLEVASGKALRVKGSQDGSANGWAGIEVPDGASLEVNGQGDLYAAGCDLAPAIGGSSDTGQGCGTINILSGMVVASVPAGSYAAAIGGSASAGAAPAAAGDVNISGGAVVAYSGASTATDGPYDVAASSLTVSDADFLCVQPGSTAPTFASADPQSASGTALYPCYVPDSWGTAGSVSVPDGQGGSTAYTAPLTDLATLLNSGVDGFAGSATNSLTQADGLAACLWLAGASYDTGATPPSYYDSYSGIALTDSSSSDITPVSGLLANVDALYKPYTALPDAAGTATYDQTNLVEAPSLSLSGGKPLLKLDPSAEQVAEQATLGAVSDQTCSSNLANGYELEACADSATSLAGVAGTQSAGQSVAGLAQDGALSYPGSDGGVWAYLLDDGDYSDVSQISAWWAPSLSGASGQDLAWTHPTLAAGRSADLWVALRVSANQVPGAYVGKVDLTLSPGL
jgi:hypothetical protein